MHLKLQHAVGAGVREAPHRAGGRVQHGRSHLYAKGRLRDGVTIQVHRHLQHMRRLAIHSPVSASSWVMVGSCWLFQDYNESSEAGSDLGLMANRRNIVSHE